MTEPKRVMAVTKSPPADDEVLEAPLDAKAQFFTALIAAKRVFGPLVKNKVNPHFGNEYADLAALHEVVDKPLEDNGLILMHQMDSDDKGEYLKTTLVHVAGYELSSRKYLPVSAKPQDVGSALTYYCRYSAQALLGIAPKKGEDDDAERATVAVPEEPKPPLKRGFPDSYYTKPSPQPPAGGPAAAPGAVVGGGPRPGARMASEKQVAFIGKLGKDLQVKAGMIPEAIYNKFGHEAGAPTELTMQEAKWVIDALLKVQSGGDLEVELGLKEPGEGGPEESFPGPEENPGKNEATA